MFILTFMICYFRRPMTGLLLNNKETSSTSTSIEFSSSEFVCGLKHWTLIASTAPVTNSDNEGQSKDNFTPDLAKLFQEEGEDAPADKKIDTVIIKPLLPSPCPGSVWKWAKNKSKKTAVSLNRNKFMLKPLHTPIKSNKNDINLDFGTPVNYDEKNSLDFIGVSGMNVSKTETCLYAVKSSTNKTPTAFDKLSHSQVVADLDRLTSTPVSTLPTKHKLAIPHKKLFDAASPQNFNTDEQSMLPSSQATESISASNSITLHSLSDKDPPAASNVVGVVHNTYGFQASQRDLGEAKVLHRKQHITLISMELHIRTRLDLFPDPEIDEIRALFYAIQTDSTTSIQKGCFIIDSSARKNFSHMKRCGITDLNCVYVESEPDLFNHLSTLILLVDPDIFLGYEVQMSSWGYLFSRAAHLGYDLCRYLSRVPSDSKNSWCSTEKDEFGADNASEIHIVGRLVLNLWRLMRSEVALYDYKFESVTYHLLHQRHPRYSLRTLTLWFDQPQSTLTNRYHESHTRALVVKYLMNRVLGNLQLIVQQDLIGRTSELARLFGIQFYEVLTRGSQYRVSRVE